MRAIIDQLPGAVVIAPGKLMKSPRHWNAAIQWYSGKLWMAYRYHFSDADPRSAIAICEISPKTFQPIGKSQYVKLERPKGDEHHEDPRLFTYKGDLYLSYTEMTHYRPGIDYKCVIKYSRLSWKYKNWEVEKTWMPRYGKNDHTAREKNWAFFGNKTGLYAIYGDSPQHTVIAISGDRVTEEFNSPQAEWPWGDIRGGAPPILTEDGYVHLFHSSVATEEAPHFMRYCAGYYVMESVAPFAIKSITVRPIAKGSEADEHREDPRFKAGWKPFVVFPCGLINRDGSGDWLISMGVNDWKVAVAPFTPDPKLMVGPMGEGYRHRYFKSINSSIPVKCVTLNGDRAQTDYYHWESFNNGFAGMVGQGYLKAPHERIAETLAETLGVTEISEGDYLRAFGLSVRGA